MEIPERKDDTGPYEKPEVRSEDVFETLALTCTKADTQCAAPPGGGTLQS